jgi:TM2 domain-containing membrane protein YozV
MRGLCLVALFLLFAGTAVHANSVEYKSQGKAILLKNYIGNQSVSDSARDTVHVKKKHKLIAAILAFPFPFGVIGAHRLYLGTSAGAELVYLATYGGAFGILPFIDFVLILINKDVNAYAGKKGVFMWSKPRTKKK